jgi:hypothetical protein
MHVMLSFSVCAKWEYRILYMLLSDQKNGTRFYFLSKICLPSSERGKAGRDD